MDQSNLHSIGTTAIDRRYFDMRCRGFTLVELMVAVVVIAIIAAIAYPSYLAYTRKAAASNAEQEVLKIAEQLERHRSRNFTYRGFDPAFMYGLTPPLTVVTVPVGATGGEIRYRITIRDADLTNRPLTGAVRGRGWAIRAESTDANNFSYLMTSAGVRCRNRAANLVTYNTCGADNTGSEAW